MTKVIVRYESDTECLEIETKKFKNEKICKDIFLDTVDYMQDLESRFHPEEKCKK